MNQQPPRRSFLSWEELRTRLDEGPHFNTMRGTPYYRDAVYAQFSKEEYARRYACARRCASTGRPGAWRLHSTHSRSHAG